jgi:hypothetical protein
MRSCFNDSKRGRASRPRLGRRQCAIDELFSFLHDCIQMIFALEAFGVDLVNVLGAGRPRREPPAAGHDLETSNGRVISKRTSQSRRDGFAREPGFLHSLGRQRLQPWLLFRCCRSVGPGVVGGSGFGGYFAVVFARVPKPANRQVRAAR